MNIVLRKARPEDREKVRWIESKSTPTLIYTPYVYDEFLSDGGEFSVEELDGELVACGKYTPLPDNSAWIETLRVIPEKQGIGLGKRLYDHWTKLAKGQKVKAMRMYTGVNNNVSAGLAERYGLKLEGTFKGNTFRVKPGDGDQGGFNIVTDEKKVARLIMPLKEAWADWLVLNRTFYRFSLEILSWMARRGMVYESAGNVIIAGARFMPHQAIHIACWGGDADACIAFAKWKAVESNVPLVSCFYEVTRPDIGKVLAGEGFKTDSSDYIVKGIEYK
jgi:ribosomal protein S18 acetylase RimI-like enzyme